jgi:hypothetical protein
MSRSRPVRLDEVVCCVNDLSELLDEVQDTEVLYKLRSEPEMESS